VSWPPASLVSHATTDAPRAANRTAMARPHPVPPAPVTMTTRELSIRTDTIASSMERLASPPRHHAESAPRPLQVDASEMLHVWEWIIEMMQECAPALILGRLPEANRMIFEPRPTNQKRVAIWLLDAFLKLERVEASIAPMMSLASVKACS